jgi:hypothetical protein
LYQRQDMERIGERACDEKLDTKLQDEEDDIL